MDEKVIIIGAGGHGKVVACTALAAGLKVHGFVEADKDRIANEVIGIPVLGGDEVVRSLKPSEVRLLNGIGSVRSTEASEKVYREFKNDGYRFLTLAHPFAWIDPNVRMDEGVQIFAGAVVQPGTKIGENACIYSGAGVDHDCTIGAHSQISPGATLCGLVRVGASTHIGAGATVIQEISIGDHCLIAAGAVVIQDVPNGTTIMGVPGQPKS